jgi:hypothetical protein
MVADTTVSKTEQQLDVIGRVDRGKDAIRKVRDKKNCRTSRRKKNKGYINVKTVKWILTIK